MFINLFLALAESECSKEVLINSFEAKIKLLGWRYFNSSEFICDIRS